MNRLINAMIPFLILTVSLSACRKDYAVLDSEPDYPEQNWEKYLGKYEVTDTLNDTTYIMEVRRVSRTWMDDHFWLIDTIEVINYAGFAHIKYWKNGPNYQTHLSMQSFIDERPYFDNDGNRWTLSPSVFVPSVGIEEYSFYGPNLDSITLTFLQSNQAYWDTDGVPFYSCDCIHLARKIE